MWTMIRIIQGQKLINQHICLLNRHLMVSLYCGLTRHRCKSGSKDSKGIFIFLRCKIIQHFQKQFFLIQPIEIGRYGINAIFLTSKWLDLKTKIFKIFSVCFKQCLFLKIQGYDQWRRKILGFYRLLTKSFNKTFVIDLLMSRMLIYDKKSVLKLYKPVRIKNLTDQLMTASGFRGQKFLFKQF